MTITTGDPTRGLKALRTQHAERGDMIAALEAIEKLGGIEAATQAAMAERTTAEAATVSAYEALDVATKHLEDAQLAVGKTEAAAVTMRQEAEAQAALILAGAHGDATAVHDEAKANAAATILTAGEAAKRILDVANAAAKDIMAQGELAKAILDDLNAQVATARRNLEEAERERQRVLRKLS